MASNKTDLCRICMNFFDQMMPIFEGEGVELELASKIEKYLPIKITPEDVLPLKVCCQCSSLLISWHNLFENCKLTDEMLQKKWAQEVVQVTIVEEDVASEERFLKYWNSVKSKRNNRVSCAYCNAILSSKKRLVNHIEECHIGVPESNYVPGGDFQCDRCWLAFGNEEEITHHMVYIHGQRNFEHEYKTWLTRLKKWDYECEICGLTLSTKHTLRRHLARHTGEKKLDAVDCPICGRRLADAATLKHHAVNTHKVPRELMYSEEKKMKAKMYVEYIKLVDGKKYYHCDYCPYVTDKGQRFERHHILHTNPTERNYTCALCSKSFRTRHDIIQHLKKKHEAMGPVKKPEPGNHMCDVCGKVFKYKQYLQSHKRVHWKDWDSFDTKSSRALRVYKCDICAKVLTQKHAYDDHMKIHNGIKDQICETCGASFFTIQHLRRHRFVHVSETPFSCSICGSSFKMMKYLKAHELTHMRQSKRKQVKSSNKSDL